MTDKASETTSAGTEGERPKSEIPSRVRDLAETSVGQAHEALDIMLEAARKAAETIQSTTNTTDRPGGVAVTKGFGFAKENITAIFGFAQQLVRAPDLKEAAQLQADFMKERAAVMQSQVDELRSLKTPKSETGEG